MTNCFGYIIPTFSESIRGRIFIKNYYKITLKNLIIGGWRVNLYEDKYIMSIEIIDVAKVKIICS